MTNSASKKAGVDRTYNRSFAPKFAFGFGHLAIVVFCAWLLLFDGWTILGNLFGQAWSFADLTRGKIILACAFLYWFRHLITLFYLLKRKVDWSEVWGLLGFMAFFEIGVLLLGGGAFRNNAISFGWLDVAAGALLLIGSFLNTFSELQRKWWKENPSNAGHIYTEGLFRYSMHINYFGDTLLFTGWCLFTYNFWTLSLPLLLALMFIFMHIPGLDAHLADRYGDEFTTYAKNTKKYIPFIY